MPRAMVGPGSLSKRSCSRDSIWRGANFSCCATSSIARPCASRASRSLAPTPVRFAPAAVGSVKFSPLQRLVLLRAREAAPKLVRIALLGDALARAALDAQREPERLGAGLGELVVARHEPARLVELALLVADLAQVDERRTLVGLKAQ